MDDSNEVSFVGVQSLGKSFRPELKGAFQEISHLFVCSLEESIDVDQVEDGVENCCNYLSSCKETASRIFTESESHLAHLTLKIEKVEEEKKLMENQVAIGLKEAKELKQTIESARLNLELTLGRRGLVPGEIDTAPKFAELNSETTRQQEDSVKNEQAMKHIQNLIVAGNLEDLKEKLENGEKEVKALADRLIQLKEEEELAKQTMDQIEGINILLDMLTGIMESGLSGLISRLLDFIFDLKHLAWFIALIGRRLLKDILETSERLSDILTSQDKSDC